MPSFADRVSETSTTTGSGDVTLAGAATGFQSFNAAYGLTKTFGYCIELVSGSEWEVGIGYLSGTTTLVRDRVLSSSNAGAAVTFSAGTKNVFSPEPASEAGEIHGMRWGVPAMTRY